MARTANFVPERGERHFGRIQLGEGHLGIGVDEGLLITPAHTLYIADVEGVLGAEVAGDGPSRSTRIPFVLRASASALLPALQ